MRLRRPPEPGLEQRLELELELALALAPVQHAGQQATEPGSGQRSESPVGLVG